MNQCNCKFDHLINNLERISTTNSLFNNNSGKKGLLSPTEGNHRKWLDKLLPNTSLILEPNIIGSSIAILYKNGTTGNAF